MDKAAICKLSETTAAKLVALAAEMKKVSLRLCCCLLFEVVICVLHSFFKTRFSQCSLIVSLLLHQILEAGGEHSAVASLPTGASRGRKQLQAYMDSRAATSVSSAASAGTVGMVRPLHEVRQNALQDLSRAQALERANARNGTAAGAGSASSSSTMDDSMKAGLKRNLASMQHVLPASGVENTSSSSSSSGVNASSINPVVAAALAAHQAAEAAAREKREAYEAWRDSMKRAKLAR